MHNFDVVLPKIHKSKRKTGALFFFYNNPVCKGMTHILVASCVLQLTSFLRITFTITNQVKLLTKHNDQPKFLLKGIENYSRCSFISQSHVIDVCL